MVEARAEAEETMASSSSSSWETWQRVWPRLELASKEEEEERAKRRKERLLCV
jgi:hypothetical protein